MRHFVRIFGDEGLLAGPAIPGAVAQTAAKINQAAASSSSVTA